MVDFIYDPNWQDGVTKKLTFFSSQSISRSKIRQRGSLSSSPIMSLSFNALVPRVESSKIVHLLKNTLTSIWVPNWTVQRCVTGVSISHDISGTSEPGDTINYERDLREDLSAGDRIMVWADSNNYHISTIRSVTRSRIVMTTHLADNFIDNNATYLMKMTRMLGRITSSQWITQSILNLSVEFSQVTEDDLQRDAIALDICETLQFSEEEIPTDCADAT